MKWNSEQECAIHLTGTDVCVDAAAGSGKTAVLIERVANLLETRSASLEEIVAITFTDAAASEMRARLRRRCREKESLSDRETMNFWRDIARRVEAARISTFHSFCGALLRQHALGMAIDPDFTVLAEAEALLLREESVSEKVRDLLGEGDQAALQVAGELGTRSLVLLLDQYLARRPLLETLCTEDLPRDLESLLAQWRSHEREAWRDYLLALRSSVELYALKKRLEEFEGICTKPSDPREVLRLDMLAALDRVAKAPDARSVESALTEIRSRPIKGARSAHWGNKEALEAVGKVQRSFFELIETLLPRDGHADLDGRAAARVCNFLAVYQKAAQAYQEAKRGRNALDFDDMVSMALTMLRTQEPLRARVAGSIRFLLVDEFQDTDPQQYEMVRLLQSAHERLEVFLVGDAKQSIYGFRNAEVGVFQAAHAGREVIRLDQNYRSGGQIIAFINDFFRSSGLLRAIDRNYHPMQANRPSPESPAIEFLVPERPGEGRLLKEELRIAEAELIASRVQELGEETGYGGIAMLFRTFSSIYLYERALRERGIPYQVAAGQGFYKCQEIMDIMNLLHVLAAPYDEVPLLGFLRGPLACLSDESLARLAWSSSLLLGFYTENIPEGFQQTKELCAARELVGDLRTHIQMPLPAFLRFVLDRTGYEAIALSQFLGVQKAANVRKLVDLADDFTRARPPRLDAFVRYLEEVGPRNIREGEALIASKEAVSLLTIHGSKGLEFPVVVLPDLAHQPRVPEAPSVLVDRVFGPVARSQDDAGSLWEPGLYDLIRRNEKLRSGAESVRVLYVGMTRARDRLLLGLLPTEVRGSWQEWFDLEFHALNRHHEETFSGNGWQARVLRTSAPPSKPKPATQGEGVPTEEKLHQRLADVPAFNPLGARFPVARLAGEMARQTHRFTTPLTARPEPPDPPSPSPGVGPMLRGTLLHRLLQRWDFCSDIDGYIEHILRREPLPIGARASLAKDLRERAMVLREHPLSRQIASDSSTKREHPFTLRISDAFVVGVIDVLLGNGEIIDYKTGHPGGPFEEEYHWQVLVYAAALRALSGSAPPSAHLFYVDCGQVHPIGISPARIDEALAVAGQAIRALRIRRVDSLPRQCE